ncbi:beta transducin-like protein HET-D2Y [Lojkania enalia]|uniref:Beta transducin-like protein HET-D2Y n=1 Tax=Lojkania enalia TaxID=147567 RepID=A0A9P4K6E1_9PLEO|nr:beta transducin-like protein HET-D2Y [Didymosphaeria enalia]
MHLLQCSGNGEYHLTKSFTNEEAIPSYAILSHTWGADGDEVTFDDLTNGTGTDKPGYEKIRFCAAQARQDGLDYFWIDTCCINKENKAELSHAINSMFRWYRNAARCYVYLSDVSTAKLREDSDTSDWESAFRRSRWFTRGWTLQELLAPRLVEFFSWQRERLGDKDSLRLQIHEITAIPERALQGELLSHFSVNDRLSWMKNRQTMREEDKVYSLLGIFGVFISPFYGEGIGNALTRLEDEIEKLERCTRDLYVTDPRHDKARIEETKGGLLEESYYWIFQNPDFLYWRNDPQSRLLWIKGDPGKGKTMLLCGIVNELSKSMAMTAHLCYFFCQATDSRINSATAVLRGLLYMLVDQQPSLVSHIRKKHDHAGKALFEDANAWVALSKIFTNILRDTSLNSTYLIVDALDECVTDLPKLLDFVTLSSSISSRVKWMVSSRNEAFIEQRLRLDDSGTRLSLELKENAAQVSRAVDAYIDHCLSELPEIQHNNLLRESVRDKMQQKASGTFLWVSLVVKELKEVIAWEVLQVLEEVPTELKDLYRRMVKQIERLQRQYPELCRQVLSTVIAAYRPLHLQELHLLSRLPTQVQDVNEATTAIVKMCGSFLTIQEGSVYIIHQSARDFLSDEASHNIFPCGIGDVHYSIVSKSLQAMSKTLRRDMYSLRALGYPAEQVEQPDPDPLAALRYSCIYWIDHLWDWRSFSSSENSSVDLQDGGVVHDFIRKKYLYWLETLSLCKSMSKGVVSMAKLETLSNERANAAKLVTLIQDARRFVMTHKWAIENSPLQAYASALVFSPAGSLIREHFKDEEPRWITIKPSIGDQWSACLQTLEGHSAWVNSVAFSHDSARLASASDDKTAKIWDASSGECLSTLEGHSAWVSSVSFSHDSARLASVSADKTVKIWNASSGECLWTLEGHSAWVKSVAFSHDSARFASASDDKTVKIWDASSGECLSTLEGHSDWGHSAWVSSVAFSHDSARLASASADKMVKIWDASSGEYLSTLEGHSYPVNSVAFSHDSARLASASEDETVKIWDSSSGKCLSTLEGRSYPVNLVAFSHDSARLASASADKTVKIWDVSSGECLWTLEGHNAWVRSVAFSHDSARLASVSDDKTVKIWDASSGECLSTLEGHSDWVNSVAFSHDSARLASASADKTVKIWDASSGECLSTLEGHSVWVRSAAFSHDSARLASVSDDKTVKIWDASSGECLWTLEGHSYPVKSVAFSHDSARLASASADKTVKIWDASSGECLSTLEGHSAWVSSVAFSHDSARLASASADKTVKIWDASSGECLQTFSIAKLLRRIAFDITSLYLHTDIGTINIGARTGSPSLPIISEPRSSQYQGLSLSEDGVWITHNSEKLLWLPSEYRPSSSAVLGSTIGIGVGTGRVWICKVK